MKMWLAMQTADGDERRFDLDPPRVILGRDFGCDLRVAVPSVAEQHCEIMVNGEAVTVRDLGSGTGTFHNGSKVDQAALSPDDEVTIGPVTFVLRTEPPATPGAIAEVKLTKDEPAGSKGGRPKPLID